MPARDEAAAARHLAGRFESGVVLPIAGLVLAAMVTLAGVVWWTAAQADSIALRDEARLLSAALAARLEAEAYRLSGYTVWDEAFERAHLARDAAWVDDNLGRYAFEHEGVATTFVVGPDGRAWYGLAGGARTDRQPGELLGQAADRHIAAVRLAGAEKPRAAFVDVGGRIVVLAAGVVAPHSAGPPRPSSAHSAGVFVTPFDQAAVENLARTYLLPGLRLVAGHADPPDGRSIAADAEGMPFPLRGPDGTPVAAFTWRTAAPGADILARVLPVLGLATLALAALAFVVLRDARASAAAIAASEGRAARDPLTGLPNRRLLDDLTETALARLPRDGGKVALLYLDLDGFKAVNDRHGHAAGDRLLCEVGRRMAACARETDTVARLGGDEFVVLQVGGAQPDGALRLAEAVLETFGRPVALETGAEVRVGASIGIALAPDHAADPRGLARRADAALYEAKNAGRGGYRIFDPASAGGAPEGDGDGSGSPGLRSAGKERAAGPPGPAAEGVAVPTRPATADGQAEGEKRAISPA